MALIDELRSEIEAHSKADSGMQKSAPGLLGVLKNDMQTVSMFLILVGGFLSLSIIGAIVGVPLIRAGFKVQTCAEQFGYFIKSGDVKSLTMALQVQAQYFRIFKIVSIISFIFCILFLLSFFVFRAKIEHMLLGA